jgi:hypothetical protein
LLCWGFLPENIKGSELMPDRCAHAIVFLRLSRSSKGTPLICACLKTLDIVLVSTVFTSILDESFRAQLAKKIWSLVRSGGAVLWYDFIYNNPSNPDPQARNPR